MANSFYNHGSIPVYKSPGSSSDIRAEFDSVTAGFNKLPTLGVGVANYLVSVDPSGTFITTIPNTYFLGTTNVLLSRASGAQALTGITSIDGQAATVVTNANLTGEVTSVGNAATLTNSAVIGKVLTGYVSGAGTLGAGDSILAAIQKLNGNIAAGAVNLTGPITSVGLVTSIASQTGTGSTFVVQTSPTLIAPSIGAATGTSLTTTNDVVSATRVQAGNGTNGAASLQIGGATNSGFVQFLSPSGTRQGYIGYSATNLATDTGALSYVAGNHTFSGTINATTINAISALTFQSAGTTYGQLAAGGNWSFGGAAGAESLRVVQVASAVNYLQINGGAAGNSVQMYSQGANANINIDYFAKGVAAHTFYTNGVPSFTIGVGTSTVNYNSFYPSATGVPLIWGASGSDANINMTVQPKGTGVLKVDCGASNNTVQLQVSSTGVQGANLLLSGNGATTPSKSIRAQAGNLEFINSAYNGVIMSLFDNGQISLGNGFGGESMRVLNVASAVNFLAVSGATTGNGTIIQASGTDANVSMSILPKGIGSVFVDGGANAGTAVLVVTNTGANGSRIKIIGNGATTPSKTLTVQAGTFNILQDAGGSMLSLTDAGALSVLGNITSNIGVIKPATFLVSGLPSAPANGSLAIVSDATSAVYRNTAVGGGAITAVVMYAGGVWQYS